MSKPDRLVDSNLVEQADEPLPLGLHQDRYLTAYITPDDVLLPPDNISYFLMFYRFVAAIFKFKGRAFLICRKTKKIKIKTAELATFFDCFESINAYSPTHNQNILYCYQVQLAFDTYKNLPERLIWATDSINAESLDLNRVKAFEAIIKAIRNVFSSPQYSTWESKQIFEQQRLLNNYQTYINHLFQSKQSKSGYRRILAVRLDLGLNKTMICRYDLDFFLSCVNRLFLHYQRQSAFKHLVGYIRKVEFGIDKGWHAHLILFFDLNRVRNGYRHAQQVGSYWQTIVAEQLQKQPNSLLVADNTTVSGVFYNCHTKVRRYKHLGIGELDSHRKDFNDKLQNLKKHVLPYLFKDMTAMSVKLRDMPKQKLLVRSQLSLPSDRQSHLTPPQPVAAQPKRAVYRRSTRKPVPQSTPPQRQRRNAAQRPLRMSDLVKKPRPYRARCKQPPFHCDEW